MRFLYFFTMLLLPSLSAFAWTEQPELAPFFKSKQVTGTFVLYDISENKMVGYNEKRAKTRFFPASTFKIPNTLIGLSVKAISSVDEVLPYGNKPQPYPSWEKDMSLQEAIAVSHVPIYQELARRIGLRQMQEEVVRLQYGNQEIGQVIDRFWLDGPLKISAIEQTQFLARLATKTLPYPTGMQQQVRDIMRLETNDRWTIFAKTGFSGFSSKETPIGWWVGWVEKSGRLYLFAINIDINYQEDLPKRIEIAKNCLTALGLLN